MKTGEILYPSCATCRWLIHMSYKLSKTRTADGGKHFEYFYYWKVNCHRVGRTNERILGLRDRVPLPHCSLWKGKVLE